MCVSHQDADHCGDLPAFIEEMNVRRILIPLGMDKNPGFMNRISNRKQSTKLICVNDEMRVPVAEVNGKRPDCQRVVVSQTAAALE